MPVCFPNVSQKLVNARSVFEGWAVLSALNVLDTFPTIICYCDKTRSLALALNFNLRFHKLFFILVPINCTKALGFVIWISYSETYSQTGQVA